MDDRKNMLKDIKKLLLKYDITVYKFVNIVNDTRFWFSEGIPINRKLKSLSTHSSTKSQDKDYPNRPSAFTSG